MGKEVLIDFTPRKEKVIAELREIALAWACGRTVENARFANSQILTGGGHSLAVSRKKVSS